MIKIYRNNKRPILQGTLVIERTNLLDEIIYYRRKEWKESLT